MWQYLAGILVKEIVSALTKVIGDFLKLQKKKKEDKQKVKNVFKEKDPATRARLIGDLLK